MSIAIEKKNNVTRRFSLVRIKPAQLIPFGDWVSIGSDLFTVFMGDFFPPIVALESAGFALTQADSPTNDGEWNYNEGTKILTLKSTAGAPVEQDYIVFYYYLFFTTEQNRSWYQDPDDPTSHIRNWQPRLTSEPAVSSSFGNIINGVFSIADSSVQLSNADGEFESYFGENDSFYNKEVIVWLYLNGFDNGQKIFVGTISALSISSTNLTLSVVDQFLKLNKPAYAGTNRVNAVAPGGTYPDDEDRPVPLIVGKSSWAKFIPFRENGATMGNAADGLRAVVKNYTPILSSSVNRSWRLARAVGPLKTQVFGSITRVATDTTPAVIDIHYFKFSSFSNVRVGDTLEWIESAVTYRGRITGVGTNAFTFSGNTYDVAVWGDSIHDGPPTTGSTMVPKKTLSVQVFDRGGIIFEKLYPTADQRGAYVLQGEDYTISEAAQSNGYSRIEITFLNNFEADYAIDGIAGTLLDPAKYSVKFNLENSGEISHAAVIENLLTDAGMTCNAASFAAADIALVENVCFSIPNIDEDAFSSYLKYIQDILSSTLGYIWINDDGEIEYNLLAAPIAGNEKNENLNYLDSVIAQLEYQDIITSYTPSNPHRQIFLADPKTAVPADDARYLHGIVNDKPFRHVMEGTSNLRITEIVALQSKRSVRYSYETSTDDIDSVLGQDVTLITPRIFGGETSANVKIIGIEKSADSVIIQTTDLMGL